MKRYFLLLATGLLLAYPAMAEESQKKIAFYGFVRNYFSFDSRENIAGTADLFNYLPKDYDWNQTEAGAEQTGIAREDLNAVPSFRFLSLTTRMGVNIQNFQVKHTVFGGKIEADFYAGLSGSTGVAQLRLRQAYMTLHWDSLSRGDHSAQRVDLLLGQTWHPMSIDLPPLLSLNSGAPFNPFNRSPQVKIDWQIAPAVSLTAAALWQMQYTSAGPDGASANYIKYSGIPEGYVGLNLHSKKGLLFRAGVDVLSILPYKYQTVEGDNGDAVTVRLNRRLTTYSPFAYIGYKHNDFQIAAKTIFAQAGEHLNLNGGYGVRATTTNEIDYTPSRNSSSWICVSYGRQVKGVLFAGYVRNFGTKDAVDTDRYFFSKNSFRNLSRLVRVSPAVVWTFGRFELGAEYEFTSAQYGDNSGLSAHALPTQNLHWVTNHRVQLMTKLNF